MSEIIILHTTRASRTPHDSVIKNCLQRQEAGAFLAVLPALRGLSQIWHRCQRTGVARVHLNVEARPLEPVCLAADPPHQFTQDLRAMSPPSLHSSADVTRRRGG